MKKIYMYVLDTMADWENGYLLHALTLQKMLPEQKYQFSTAGISKQPVKTAGGMTLVPDISIDQMDLSETAALILIGADTWMDEEQQKILNLASQLAESGALIAAICGATLGLANAGLLDAHAHTSNAPFFLTEMAPNYKGMANYREAAAVSDANIITAGSAGSLLWARYILEYLELFSPETINAWYSYFQTGDAKYFGELMSTPTKITRRAKRSGSFNARCPRAKFFHLLHICVLPSTC